MDKALARPSFFIGAHYSETPFIEREDSKKPFNRQHPASQKHGNERSRKCQDLILVQ
jgi:hypothetical protein